MGWRGGHRGPLPRGEGVGVGACPSEIPGVSSAQQPISPDDDRSDDRDDLGDRELD